MVLYFIDVSFKKQIKKINILNTKLGSLKFYFIFGKQIYLKNIKIMIYEINAKYIF